MSGAFWGSTDNVSFIEEKHPTGFCLEIFVVRKAATPIKAGEPIQWEDCTEIVDQITVPQAEALAESLKEWALHMREGGHYIDA